MRKIIFICLILLFSTCLLNSATAGGPDDPIRDKSEKYPAMEFAACGFLMQGENCMFFLPAGDSIKLVLDEYGDFQEFDSVFVEGNLNIYCETDCIGADGCVEDNSIMECGYGNGIPFQGCGTLLASGDCMYFAPDIDSVIWELSNYGDFQAGDYVFVAGTLFPDDVGQCGGADAYLINFYITEGNCDDQPFPFQCCGTLVQGTECVLFAPWCEIAIMTPNGIAEFFVLDNYGGFQVGDSVMVYGLVDVNCETACPDGDACIIYNTIDTCYGGTPVDSISGCGVLMESGECILFALENTTVKFTLGNYGEFQPGDSAYIEGFVYWGEDSVCLESSGYINNWLIQPCEGDPNIPFQSCGVLVWGGENCVLFAAFGFGDSLYVLENYGSYQVGDLVYVNGWLESECYTTCIGDYSCIMENTIGPCGEPSDTITLYGVLVDGPNCLLFEPATYDSMMYVLDNYGSFGIGDSVEVTGFFDPDCNTICIGASACILDNTIQAWGTPPDTITLYGVLVDGPNCLLFEPATYDSMMYVLDNYGSFGIGDSVEVTGFFDPDCNTICIGASACILDNTIQAWGGNPGVPFESCGLLVQVEYCLLFAPDGFGDTMFVLENYGDFQEGDSVFVDGYLETNCGTICMGAMGCIWDNTIALCETPLDTVTLYGTLVQGTDCVLFEPAFTFVYTLMELDNYGDFQVGDSVIVTGILDSDCETVCTDADGCILDNTIEAWDSNPGTYYEGIGYLYAFGECILFIPFDSYYEEYVLDNYGDFGPYDTVFVTGMRYFWCDDPCITDTGGCILDNTIDDAGFPDSAAAPISRYITDVNNYPNPFNPTATITFNLNAPSRVTLTIYNILGQQVEVLIDNKLLDGPQTAKWNGDKHASGIYFYRIQTDHEVITKKMSLSK